MDWERQYRKQCYDPIMHRYMEGFLQNVAWTGKGSIENNAMIPSCTDIWKDFCKMWRTTPKKYTKN